MLGEGQCSKEQMMKIIEQFTCGQDGKANRSNLSFEIFPPKYDVPLSDVTAVLDVLASLKPDYISVTFGAGGSANNNRTIELSRHIREKYAIECLVHLTSLCYDKREIDEFLSRLADNGLFNILALRGDKRPGIEAKGDFPHASDLIRYVKASKWGKDFCVAAACYPSPHPDSASVEDDILRTVEKEKCGAQFFISQLFFSNTAYGVFEKNLRQAGCTAPVCAGIMPVVNKKQIERVVSMCGAPLSERFCRIVEKYGDDKDAMMDAGLAFAISQIIDLCASGHEYIHLYTMNNPVVARRIADALRHIMAR